MNRFWKITAALVLTIGLMFSAVPAKADMKDFWAKVYTWDGKQSADGKPVLTEVSSGITFVVMQRNSVATLETLYIYGGNNTTFENPVTGTNFASDTVCADMVRFRADPGETNDTYVDLIVVDQNGGYTAFVEDFTVYDHAIVIDERPNIRHHGVAWLATNDTSSSEIDTGINFDKVSVIDKMLIEIGTALAGEAGPYVNVGILSSGTNGDADGFIKAEVVATAGWHDPLRSGVDHTSYSVTSSEQAGIINVGAVGTFLGHMYAGSGDTETLLPESLWLPSQLILHGTWETSLTYTYGTAAVTSGFGMIHFWFTRIR